MEAKLQIHGDSYALLLNNKIVAFASDDFTNDNLISKLSLKNCEAIERGYDLDELAKKFRNETIMNSSFISDETSFKEGAKAIIEILGDKKFSEVDVLKVVTHVLNELVLVDGFDKQYLFPESIYQETTTKCKSLQQTEWDVVIVTKPFVSVSLIIVDFSEDTPVDVLNVKKEVVEEGYALDEDGCLILKRK